MQLAQNYPANQSIQYGGYDNRKSYASQSFVDPRLTGAHGYSGYYNGQHNAPTVYPDAVYPSQYTPINNSHILGHQVTYQPGPNNYKAQYPNSQQPYYNNQLPFAHQPHYTRCEKNQSFCDFQRRKQNKTGTDIERERKV